MASASHHARARHIRRVSSSAHLDDTLRKAARVLAAHGIPSLVVGGYAVQENGYPRYTADVDLVVPDVDSARACLASAAIGDTSVIHLLPGGRCIDDGPVPLPLPIVVSAEPIIADLPIIIAIQLSHYLGSPFLRLQSLADVTELIKANLPPRDLPLPEQVIDLYRRTWDGLAAEGAIPRK